MKPHNKDGSSADTPNTFGRLLRYYRTTYGERLRKKYPRAARVKLTALALIECIGEQGYSLTSGAYSEIEAGSTFPRDPQRFIDAVAKCLLLDSVEDYERLARQLAYDMVRERIGKRIADIAIKPPAPIEHDDDDSEDPAVP